MYAIKLYKIHLIQLCVIFFINCYHLHHEGISKLFVTNPIATNRKDPHEKRVIDLNKPLTAGAFVDTERIRELHDTLSQQLPPEPPMSWILDEKEKMDMVRSR